MFARVEITENRACMFVTEIWVKNSINSLPRYVFHSQSVIETPPRENFICADAFIDSSSAVPTAQKWRGKSVTRGRADNSYRR